MPEESFERLLIIRFSSFGDVAQAAGIPLAFRSVFPKAKVDWLVRSEFADLLEGHPALAQVIRFERAQGLSGLIRLAWRLAQPDSYSHVYDANSNLRSHLIMFIFRIRSLGRGVRFLTRPKYRFKRWLFFKLRLPVFPTPYRGAESFIWPLRKWAIQPLSFSQPILKSSRELPIDIALEIGRLPRPLIALAPSAAWPMKRWPIAHWRWLIEDLDFAGIVLFGGREDVFLEDLVAEAPLRVLNLAGRLSLGESQRVLAEADLVIANDTGLLHLADQMERPALALIGPTAFGYPSHRTSRTLEIDLWCKPCTKDGRGRCRNDLYQRCLVDLRPETVAQVAREVLRAPATRGEYS